jgi:hypothetical protein
MMEAIEEKFHVGRNLTFAFIDSWAKHPMNLGDQQQQDAFARETNILWNFALSKEEFVFKSIQDVLDENQKLKAEVEFLNENIDTIYKRLNTIEKNLAEQEVGLTEAGKNISSLKTDSSKHNEEILGIRKTLTSHQSQFEADESRILSTEKKVLAHDTTLDGINKTSASHQTLIQELTIESSKHREEIDDIEETSASYQTSIDELKSVTQNLDQFPLGTIMSYHPKNGETFPVGWLACDGSNIGKGDLKGETTPGNSIFSNIT